MTKLDEEIVALFGQQAKAVQHDTIVALREQLATAQQNAETLRRVMVDEATTIQKMLHAQDVSSTEISNHLQSQTLEVYTKVLSRIGDKSNDVGGLQAKVAALARECAEYKTQLQDSQEDTRRLQQELEAARSEAAELRTNHSPVRGRSSSLDLPTSSAANLLVLALQREAGDKVAKKQEELDKQSAEVARLEATVVQLRQEIQDKKSVEKLVKGLPSLVGSVSLGENAINEIAAKVSETVRSSFPPSNPPSRHVGCASESLPITRKRPRQEANLHATEPNPPSDPEAAAFDHVLEELVTNLHKFPLRASPKGKNPVDIRILIGDLVKYILYPTSRRFLEEFL